MLTLQEYSEKVNKLLIFCFPIFVLFCMFFVSQMPVTTELKSPPPKMEKRLIYELKLTRVRVPHNEKTHNENIIILNLEQHIKANICKNNSEYGGGYQDYLLYWLRPSQPTISRN